MASIDLTGIPRSVETSVQQMRHGQHEPAARQQELSVADSVRLSSEARKRMDELSEGQTVAEAFLKHLLETRLTEASQAESNKDPAEEDAARKVKGAFDRVMVDLGWLIEAMGVPPEEAPKLRSVLAARASVDYAIARPPVPEIVMRAAAENEVPTLFVQDLSIGIVKDRIDSASVQRVAVTRADPSLNQQLADPNAPRVVVMADQSQDGTLGSRDAFDDNINARLMQPHPELQGMLIVRENGSSGESRRLRIDVLMPLERAQA